MSANTLLRIDSSARGGLSITRQLTAYACEQLHNRFPELHVQSRDVGSNPFPAVSAEQLKTIHGSLETSDPQIAAQVALSDQLVAEALASKLLVIGAPMYNFGIPANLKVWIDHICRARHTFRYTETGPEGLTPIEHAIVVVASGGAPVGSGWDFVSPYLRHVLSFIGVKEVHIIDAGGSGKDAEATVQRAKLAIEQLIEKI